MSCGTGDIDDVSEDLVGDEHLLHGGTSCGQLGGPGDGAHRGQVARVEAVRVSMKDRDLLVPRRQGNVELQQKPVELCFR